MAASVTPFLPYFISLKSFVLMVGKEEQLISLLKLNKSGLKINKRVEFFKTETTLIAKYAKKFTGIYLHV